jgi:diacylglycerol kinase (ATP)
MTQLGKVALIYNPVAGSQRKDRALQVLDVAEVLRLAGVEAETIPTTAPGAATEQTQAAMARGCTTVFACGGDGTVNEVLQGLVGTPAALGVVPLGTANSLAADLRLPRNPAAAARALLAARPVRISVARIDYQSVTGAPACRYFTVAAGAGPDAHLFYILAQGAKRRFGYLAYFLQAVNIWATHRYPLFAIEFTPPGASSPQQELVSQLLAIRIGDFGGILRRLAPGAALQRDDLRLVRFRTRSRARFLQYLSAVWFGREPRVPGVELASATSVRCHALPAERIHVEADGEVLGVLPVTLTMVPDALTLLMPKP